jgi:hypothetical protein
MISTIDLRDNIDLDEVIRWVVDNCHSFVEYRVTEILWEIERHDDDAWFKLEVTFTNEEDATLFLLRWS